MRRQGVWLRVEIQGADRVLGVHGEEGSEEGGRARLFHPAFFHNRDSYFTGMEPDRDGSGFKFQLEAKVVRAVSRLRMGSPVSVTLIHGGLRAREVNKRAAGREVWTFFPSTRSAMELP